MELTLPGAPRLLQRGVETGVRGSAQLGRLPSPLRTMGLALVLGWVADALFFKQSLGVSFPLFIALFVATLFGVARLDGVRVARRNLWLLAPLAFFSSMVAVRANGVLTFWNFAASIALSALLGYFFAAGRIERLGSLGYAAVLGLVGRFAITKPAPVAMGVGRYALTNRGKVRLAVPVLRGLALALPVLVLFTILLASADQFFSRQIEDVLRTDFLRDLPERLGHLNYIVAVTWLCGGTLLYAMSRRQLWPHAETQEALPGSGAPTLRIGWVEVVTVLALVDLLFLSFASTQFTYLFSGHAAATMHFEDYRHYARRGFGELLAVSVLTMCLIRCAGWLALKRSPCQVFVLQALSTVMIGLAGVMLASAFQRMLVWESVEYYINTEIRLYVRWFIIWLGLAYAWLLGTLWLRADRFAIGAFVAALGFLATINVLNPDADVAHYNLGRRDDLSTRYLALLSDDAVPALVAGLEGAPLDVAIRVRADLASRLDQLEAQAATDRWPAFHFARSRAHAELTALRKSGRL